MRGFRNPIGPIHPSFYWRRRALVLAVVLALLILGFVVKQLWASGDSAGQGKASASATAAASGSAVSSNATSSPASATTATAAGSSETATNVGLPTAATASSSAKPSSSPSTAAVPKCDNAKVKVSIKANSLVRINTDLVVNLALTNATPDVCQVDFATTPFELKVYSGSDRIWSTNDFPALAPSGKLTLDPGKPHTFNITWPTKRSVAKGKLSADELKSGTYIATASLAGAAEAKQVMRLYHK